MYPFIRIQSLLSLRYDDKTGGCTMNTTKQLIAILLVLTMVVGLAACGSSSANESENAAPITEQKNETVPEATTPSADVTEPNNISSETIDDVV